MTYFFAIFSPAFDDTSLVRAPIGLKAKGFCRGRPSGDEYVRSTSACSRPTDVDPIDWLYSGSHPCPPVEEARGIQPALENVKAPRGVIFRIPGTCEYSCAAAGARAGDCSHSMLERALTLS